MNVVASSRPEALRRLYRLMQRVNASADLSEVLDEVAHGVVEVLGFGVAAISRLEADTLVMTNVAAPPHVRDLLLGRRTPVASLVNEFDLADEWGVLRFLPHDRLPAPLEEAAWVPDLEPSAVEGAWHPLDTLYAPLWSATGRLLGNMSVDLPADGMVPGELERELLEMFVVQAGLAMDNAQQRERLATQVRMGEVLGAASAAARLADLDLTLEGVGRAVADGFGVDEVAIRCVTSGDLENLEESHFYSTHVGGSPGLARVAAGLAVGAARSGHPAVLGPMELSRVSGLAPEKCDATVLLAPVGDRDTSGYLLVARRPGTSTWSELEQETVGEIGRLLGRVVLDARILERERHLVGELRELDRYKGELIATISHELKTPLSSIVGHAELLTDLDTGIGSVEAIARNARRLDRLVQNLLDYSALEESRVHVPRPADLRVLAAASVELIAVQAERGGLVLNLDVPSETVPVDADPDELGTVVDNLLGNAVKYTLRGGEVTVAVGSDDAGGVWLECTDTGLGISAADQVHLFSAFHRSTNPEALSLPGSGLGLAISRRIVHLHGGRIVVRSDLGVGSTFRVCLPRGRG